MEGHSHHHQHQHHHHLQQIAGTVNIDVAGDRFPQWTIQETRDFLVIRAELDQAFMETKRNKLLWEVIATKMREKGYSRSAEQCKCKWKNLVTRYKGCETMESEAMRQQFPFFNELQTIFAARMQRMLWMEAEGGAAGRSKRKGIQSVSSDEEDENDEDSDGGKKGIVNMTKKKKKLASKAGTSNIGGSSGRVDSSLKEVLEEFMRQQMEMEMERLRSYEAREAGRREKEMEWRQAMKDLENERMMMDKMWREREEQRRIREEARAERRDALVTTLLNKLTREDRM